LRFKRQIMPLEEYTFAGAATHVRSGNALLG
jgi:hypothetical protein